MPIFEPNINYNRLMSYNWQQPDWKNFRYSQEDLEDLLFVFAEKAGHLSGLAKAMPESFQEDALIEVLVSEAMKTSEIENEYLSRIDIASSIRNNLGLSVPPEKVKDVRAKGIGKLITVVRQTYDQKLSNITIKQWHSFLFSKQVHIGVGKWRTHEEPMQVVSGVLGKEKVHFEAPPSSKVPENMDAFVEWFNKTAPQGKSPIKHPPIRAAITHLYFESIHPFEDGNGRIGRALADKALSQSLGYPLLLSLSATIESNKKAYYAALKKAQRSNEITPWLIYFLQVIIDAQHTAETLIKFTIKKAQFFDLYKTKLNERQLKCVQRILQEGPLGFEGGMTAKKYMHITKTSKATATRDLSNLEGLGVFEIHGAGRSTRYYLNLDDI